MTTDLTQREPWTPIPWPPGVDCESCGIEPCEKHRPAFIEPPPEKKGTGECTTCGRMPGLDCRPHFTGEIGRLRALVRKCLDRLSGRALDDHAWAIRFAWEDGAIWTYWDGLSCEPGPDEAAIYRERETAERVADALRPGWKATITVVPWSNDL